jgi:anti-anti-sigma regulatory factor
MSEVGGTSPKQSAVVHLRGEIDLSAAPKVQRDLDGVTSIDANGLGILVAALGRATSRGGDIVLICSSEALRAQFTQCRLDRVFEFR